VGGGAVAAARAARPARVWCGVPWLAGPPLASTAADRTAQRCRERTVTDAWVHVERSGADARDFGAGAPTYPFWPEGQWLAFRGLVCSSLRLSDRGFSWPAACWHRAGRSAICEMAVLLVRPSRVAPHSACCDVGDDQETSPATCHRQPCQWNGCHQGGPSLKPSFPSTPFNADHPTACHAQPCAAAWSPTWSASWLPLTPRHWAGTEGPRCALAMPLPLDAAWCVQMAGARMWSSGCEITTLGTHALHACSLPAMPAMLAPAGHARHIRSRPLGSPGCSHHPSDFFRATRAIPCGSSSVRPCPPAAHRNRPTDPSPIGLQACVSATSRGKRTHTHTHTHTHFSSERHYHTTGTPTADHVATWRKEEKDTPKRNPLSDRANA
jgi:hypothetical protein